VWKPHGGPSCVFAEAASGSTRIRDTIIRAITAGEISGGAMPRPESMRGMSTPTRHPTTQRGPCSNPAGPDFDELRAPVVSLTEANGVIAAAADSSMPTSSPVGADNYRCAVARTTWMPWRINDAGYLGRRFADQGRPASRAKGRRAVGLIRFPGIESSRDGGGAARRARRGYRRRARRATS